MTAGRIVHEGKVYFTVGEAARDLSTTATKIRQMMGSGDLEWTQLKGRRPVMIPAESILALKRRRDQESPTKVRSRKQV